MPSWAATVIESISNITRNSSRRRSPFFLWARVVLWCGVIFAFSAMPNYKGNVSDFENVSGILEFLSRKFCHAAEYAILMVLAWRAIEDCSDRPVPGQLILSFLFVLLYSISDEWHQTFVFGRSGSSMDVFIDSVGSVLGAYYCHRRDQKGDGQKNEDQSPQDLEN